MPRLEDSTTAELKSDDDDDDDDDDDIGSMNPKQSLLSSSEENKKEITRTLKDHTRIVVVAINDLVLAGTISQVESLYPPTALPN